MSRPRHEAALDEAIRRLHEQGRSVRQIAAEVGVSRSTVHRVLTASRPPDPSQHPAAATDSPG